MKKHPLHLNQLLHQSGSLPELAEKAELLLYLDQYVKSLLSDSISKQLKVANLRKTILVIETTSASWAARINFQKKSLLQQLQAETLPMLTAIEVKVNPTLQTSEATSQITYRELTDTAADHINALADTIDGSLGIKLKRLASLASRKKQD